MNVQANEAKGYSFTFIIVTSFICGLVSSSCNKSSSKFLMCKLHAAQNATNK